MKKAKKLISCFLIFALVFAAIPGITAELPFAIHSFAAEGEIVDSGETTDGLSWIVYSCGELVIFGDGKIQDYFTEKNNDYIPDENCIIPENISNYYNDPTPWSEYMHEITSVTVEEGITSLGKNTFFLFYNVKNISLPNSLVEINDYAFFGMYSLHQINIPSNVRHIGNSSFESCVALKNITLPEGLETIGNKVFAGCLSLKEIIIPENTVGEITPLFFEGCFDLEKLVIPEGVTFNYNEISVNYEQEWNLYNLTYLSIPESFDCSIRIKIPSIYIKEIYNYSKSAVFLISENSYYPEYQRLSFTSENIIPAKNAYIESLTDMLRFTHFSVENLIFLIYDINLSKEELIQLSENPEQYANYMINKMCDTNYSFAETMLNINSWSYTLSLVNYCTVFCYEDSAQHSFYKTCDVHDYAKHVIFETKKECLNELELSGEKEADDYSGNIKWEINPEEKTLTLSGDGIINLQAAKNSGWYNASHLIETVVFDKNCSFTKISQFAFSGLRIKEFTLPPCLTYIENHAFDGCVDLKTIYIPKNSHLTYFKPMMGDILENRFNACYNHTAFVVEEGNNTYSSYDGALYNAERTELLYVPQGKTSIDISDTTKDIALFAFYMSNVDTVTIPDSVKNLYCAFLLCQTKTINIGSGVSYIPNEDGSYEFDSCYMLEKIMVDADNATYSSDEEGILYNKEKTELLRYPGGKTQEKYSISDKVTTICENAFSDTLHLKTITITEGVEELKSKAFFNTSATKILLPGSLKKIHYNTFTYSDIKEITIPSQVKKVGKTAFSFCENLEKITFLNPDTYIFDGDTYSPDNEYYVIEEDYEYFIGGYSDGSDTIPEDTVIYGYKGSTAESYALKYGRTFVEISGCQHSGGEATCITLAVCDLCGQEYGTYKDHIEDSYTENETCTVNGYTLTYCTVCYEELNYEIIEAKHLWDENYTEITPPTCTEEGLEKRICQRCDEEDFRSIPLAQHDFEEQYTVDKEASCTENGSQSRHCKNCTAVTDVAEISAPGHSFSDWHTIREASFTEEGIKERECTVCPYYEQDIIPPLEQKEYEDEDSGIKITAGKEAYGSNDIEVDIKEVFDGSHFLALSCTKKTAFNITTLIDGEEVQPDIPVYVQIPVPKDFNQNSIAVFHINSATNERERMDIEVIDGYICFYASSFSIYIIADESTYIDDNDEPTPDCDHLCHKKGFLSFLWKIINFFSKLFNVNPVCSCGKAHY